MNKLVLKGTHVLSLPINCRSSKDIDFSIDNEFPKVEMEQIIMIYLKNLTRISTQRAIMPLILELKINLPMLLYKNDRL